MKKLIQQLPHILAFLFIILYAKECMKPPEYIEKKVTVLVPAPELQNTFTTFEPVPMPKPKVVDDKWYNYYKQLKDSIARDSMVKDLATIRDYTNTYEDTVQTITTETSVRGFLLSETVSYKLKPFKIKHDTIIRFKKPKKIMGLDIGVDTRLPTKPEDSRFVIKPEIGIRVGDLRISGSYDTESTFWLGASYIIF